MPVQIFTIAFDPAKKEFNTTELDDFCINKQKSLVKLMKIDSSKSKRKFAWYPKKINGVKKWLRYYRVKNTAEGMVRRWESSVEKRFWNRSNF